MQCTYHNFVSVSWQIPTVISTRSLDIQRNVLSSRDNMILNFYFDLPCVKLHLDDVVEVLLMVVVEFLHTTKLVYKYLNKIH